MAPKIFNMKVNTIPMTNFPKTAKLCYVDSLSREFRLGKLSFKFPRLSEYLKQHQLFLENFLILDIIDKELPKEYIEEVEIEFEDNEGSHNTVEKGTFVYKGFVGLTFKNKRGVLLRVGIIGTGDEKMLEYVFEYSPKNLFINSIDYHQLYKSVNEV